MANKYPVHPGEASTYGYKDTSVQQQPNNVQPQNTGYTPYAYTPVQVYQPGQTLDTFKTQAANQYTPIYNEKVTALKNALAQNLLALEGQKGGINKNYDMQVDNQNMNSTKSKNNYSNTMLGRGLGRSTIVGTGLGEMDLTNNRLVNTINSYRTNDLGAVDSQKALAQTNTNNQLAQMSGDLQMQIMSLAQNLYDNYQGNMFKQESFNSGNQFDVAKYNNGNQQWQQEFDYGKTQDSQKQNNWQQEFNLDKAYKDYLMKQPYGGSGGSSGSGKDYKSPNGFGAGEDAKEYDEFLSAAQYIMSSDRDADSKLNDLKSMYETARAERSPEGDALARTISGMISSIQNQTAGLNTYKQQMQSQMNSQPAQTTTNTSSGFSDLVKNLAKKLSPFGKY